ncbi:unnamed protein product [Durusdinium trenchii]|uniref:HEAT repeat-containing protein 1 n=1 Tax=Durusdinium trenchii TaxID=1381693 RepID=A0ABP0QNV8_9DINO
MGSRGGQHRSLGGRQKYSTDQVIVHDLSRTMESSTVPGSLHQTHDFRCLETRGSSGHLWNLRALGRVCSALRRLFWSPRSARFEEKSLQNLFQLASLEMLRRDEDELSFHEVGEILLGLIICPEEDLPPWQDLQSLCCRVIMKRLDAPPIYLCHMFYAFTALDLFESGEAAEGREGAEESPVRQAHQRVAEAILPVFSVCLAPEVEVMAQSLLALSRRASSEHLSSLGFRLLLLVSQREAVRKANDFDSSRLQRLGAVLAAAAWPWRLRLLQPWFLPELARAPSGQRSPWLLSAAATSTEPAWPPCVAWHLERESGAQRARWALEEVYGPGKLMGWEEDLG